MKFRTELHAEILAPTPTVKHLVQTDIFENGDNTYDLCRLFPGLPVDHKFGCHLVPVKHLIQTEIPKGSLDPPGVPMGLRGPGGSHGTPPGIPMGPPGAPGDASPIE